MADVQDRQLGARLRTMTHAFSRRFMEEARQAGLDEPSLTHGWIISFLYDNADRDVYQRDLEESFHITRSSVSGAVKLMEQKGYLTRQSVPGDARLKKLTLTEAGYAFRERSHTCFQTVEAQAVQGLSQEELDTFFRLSAIIKENLFPRKECSACGNPKDFRFPDQGI